MATANDDIFDEFLDERGHETERSEERRVGKEC